MIAKASASMVCGPKFIVPRQSWLTFRPVRPSCVYCMVYVSYRERTGRLLYQRPGPFNVIAAQ